MAKVTLDIIKGMVNIPMHFREFSSNLLTNGSAIDLISGIPEYKACAVIVIKLGESK